VISAGYLRFCDPNYVENVVEQNFIGNLQLKQPQLGDSARNQPGGSFTYQVADRLGLGHGLEAGIFIAGGGGKDTSGAGQGAFTAEGSFKYSANGRALLLYTGVQYAQDAGNPSKYSAGFVGSLTYIQSKTLENKTTGYQLSVDFNAFVSFAQSGQFGTGNLAPNLIVAGVAAAATLGKKEAITQGWIEFALAPAFRGGSTDPLGLRALVSAGALFNLDAKQPSGSFKPGIGVGLSYVPDIGPQGILHNIFLNVTTIGIERFLLPR
jgi:hypothetical protein